jgi:hypothetical protein
MGFMVLDPNNDRGHQIDGTSEKGQEYQAVPIFGKDSPDGSRYFTNDTGIMRHFRLKISIGYLIWISV